MNDQELIELVRIHDLITSGRADDARIKLEELIGSSFDNSPPPKPEAA